MLFCQNFCRGHDRALAAPINHPKAGEQGHQSFSGADVSLQKSLHCPRRSGRARILVFEKFSAFVVAAVDVAVDLSDCIITGQVLSAGNCGGALADNGGSVTLSGCAVTNNSGYNGAGVFADTGGTITLTDCTVSGNSASTGYNDVIAAGGTVTLTIDSLLERNSAGSVTISSGASINLTSSIAPGGGITLYGGHYEAPTTIIGSGGVSRTFEDLEIKGSTINNAGLIFGATIYSNEGDDHEVRYTEDGGVTSSSVFISGQTAFTVPGGLMQVLNT